MEARARIPCRKFEGADGCDLYGIEEATISSGGRKLVRTRLAMVIPKGLYERIAPRSGLALAKGLSIGASVVDSNCRGGVGVLLFNQDQEDITIELGDRIAQMIFERIVVPKLEEATECLQIGRGDFGFGSTGMVNFVSKLAMKDMEEAIWREHNPAHRGAKNSI